jgi:hypothetical protein
MRACEAGCAFEDRVITAKQIRAARAYLHWTEAKLAQMSKLSVAVIKRVEADGPASSMESSAICQALERAGIVFLENGIRQRNA